MHNAVIVRHHVYTRCCFPPSRRTGALDAQQAHIAHRGASVSGMFLFSAGAPLWVIVPACGNTVMTGAYQEALPGVPPGRVHWAVGGAQGTNDVSCLDIPYVNQAILRTAHNLGLSWAKRGADEVLAIVFAVLASLEILSFVSESQGVIKPSLRLRLAKIPTTPFVIKQHYKRVGDHLNDLSAFQERSGWQHRCMAKTARSHAPPY